MKVGRSINEIAAQIKAEHEQKKDYVASTTRLNYNPTIGQRGALEFAVNGDTVHPEPTAHCLRQIGDRVGIPAKYMERMANGHRELLAHNINHWFQAKPEKRMLRTLLNGNQVARAFLSDRYRPLDNYDLANTVLPRLSDAGCEVKSIEITETRLYIQAVTPRMQLDLNALRKSGKRVGEIDPVQAGVVISNSEVGAGALSVDPLLWKLGCLNGLIYSVGMRRHHIGRNVFAEQEEAAAYFTDETRQLDDKAFWAKVNDVVTGVLDFDKFKSLSEKFAATGEIRLERGAIDSVELLVEPLRLNETEKKGVLDHLIEGGDLSLFGLVNAVTRTAEDAESYDRAIELERAGGEIIELPPTMWRKIN